MDLERSVDLEAPTFTAGNVLGVQEAFRTDYCRMAFCSPTRYPRGFDAQPNLVDIFGRFNMELQEKLENVDPQMEALGWMAGGNLSFFFCFSPERSKQTKNQKFGYGSHRKAPWKAQFLNSFFRVLDSLSHHLAGSVDHGWFRTLLKQRKTYWTF